MAECEETLTPPINMKAITAEIDNCWNGYLNALNNLCSAGNKLAMAIAKLEQGLLDKTAPQTSSYLTNSWNDLARATAVATNTVKAHIMSVLQDYFIVPANEQQQQTPSQTTSAICEKEQKRIRDHSRLLALENAQTMINIQHQFCAASYDAFSSLTCCFVCQSPVGFAHESSCTMIKQKTFLDQRSQTPSPHCNSSYKSDYPRANSLTGALALSPGHIADPINFGIEPPRGTSPQQNFPDQIPLQAIFETIRGPLPNPGHLLGMKTPFFYRNTKSSQYCLFNCPLFPLSGQRRWSEAAAVEASDSNFSDAESQMRRWSMPWEARSDQKNTVAWSQTRIMPALKLSNNSPDLHWQSPISSQDGLIEAIQLLSCKPATSNVTTTNVHIPD